MIWDDINKLNLVSLSVNNGNILFDYLEDNAIELPGYNNIYSITNFKYYIESIPNKGYINVTFIDLVETEYRIKSVLRISTSLGIKINKFTYSNLFSIINILGQSNKLGSLNGLNIIESPFYSTSEVVNITTTTTTTIYFPTTTTTTTTTTLPPIHYVDDELSDTDYAALFTYSYNNITP